VAVLTVALAVAVTSLGMLLLLLAYAAHTHSAARWAAAVDEHNRRASLWNPRTGQITYGEDQAA
jgi:hypothetical protein